MKKLCIISAVCIIISVITTACTYSTGEKQNLIQSKRRFADFANPQEQKDSNTIDLSEGPRLRYDAHLGPQNLNFDIKIVDPY